MFLVPPALQSSIATQSPSRSSGRVTHPVLLRNARPRGDAPSAAMGSGISKSLAVGGLWFLAYVHHLQLSFQDESRGEELLGHQSSLFTM